MRLLMLGTGSMAREHAKRFSAMDDVTLVACADVVPEARDAFARDFNIPACYATVEEALNAGGFDAAANITPDAIHHPTTLPLLDAGIHVFCEKPLASNHADAAEMAARAAAAGVINGVNLTYRNVSALQTAAAMIAAGEIGTVRHIEASYLQSWLTQPAWGDWKTEDRWLWRLSTAHGSMGVLGDVGIHILDFATYAAGIDVEAISCNLTTYDKAPGGKIGDYTLDANDSFAAALRLSGDATGVLHASRFASGHFNDLRLRMYGDKGGLEVTNSGDLGTLRASTGPAIERAEWHDIELAPVTTTYARFVEAVAGGTPMNPDFARAARLQAVLDAAVASDTARAEVRIKT